jgi:hypothetical protein
MGNIKITSMNRRAFLAALASGAFSTAGMSAFDIRRALAKEPIKGDKGAGW